MADIELAVPKKSMISEYDISLSEVEEKINVIPYISEQDKDELRQLIWKLRDVFS